jgi:hypothetical protein
MGQARVARSAEPDQVAAMVRRGQTWPSLSAFRLATGALGWARITDSARESLTYTPFREGPLAP